jgi:RNA polymerase sigma-70 factor (ECF subfamily)
MAALGAMLAADVGMWADGGGKRPAAAIPILGKALVLKVHRSVAVLLRKYGSTLIRIGLINGLPGFVTREADGELQTTALEIEDGKITGIYVMRNPDKLRHVN